MILGALIFFSPMRGFGLCVWLHCLDMAAWFKLTSKSLACQASGAVLLFGAGRISRQAYV